MDQYNILERALISAGLKHKDYGRSNRRLSRWLMALVAMPVVAVSLIGTHSIAGSYLFLAVPAPENTTDISTGRGLSTSHSSVSAAAFGFQAAGFSVITVRTYDGPTGVILSEDSFDVSIREEGAAERDANKGRIFAGGIGTDSEGQSRFMLRVYDAETGRFLWEGQLNLLKAGVEGLTRAQVIARSNKAATDPTVSYKQASFKMLFSLRAVNPVTGVLLWQDQFAPGNGRERKKASGVALKVPAMRPTGQPLERIFGLSVRAYDRTTGTLLWEDSFEQLEPLEDSAVEPYTDAYPQVIPSWNPSATGNEQSHQILLR